MERNTLIRFLADEARTLVLFSEGASADNARAMLAEAGELLALASNIAARGDAKQTHYAYKTQEAA
jgi:hypothetical protein